MHVDLAQVEWASFGCDFYANDISYGTCTSVSCCIQYCYSVTGCTHFTFDPVSKRCYAKSGQVSSVNSGTSNSYFTCGIIVGWVSNGCDFYGNDIQCGGCTSLKQCIQTCYTVSGCTHFTFNPSSQACCVKSGNVTPSKSFAASYGICGLL